MFWKMLRKKKSGYEVGSDDLAVPEVHTGKVAHEDTKDTQTKGSISYDNVAIPEIHIPHKKK